MIGLLLVLGLVAGFSAAIAVGLRMWAGGLGRRWRLAIAALLSAAAPMAIPMTLVLHASDMQGQGFALLSIAGFTLVLAVTVGLPVAWLMERGAPPPTRTSADEIETFR